MGVSIQLLHVYTCPGLPSPVYGPTLGLSSPVYRPTLGLSSPVYGPTLGLPSHVYGPTLGLPSPVYVPTLYSSHSLELAYISVCLAVTNQ